MTDDDLPPRLTRLTFHGPLSEARAARLVGRLTRTSPATVLDLGCGWGELMLRILAAVPGAAGTGIDRSGADLARGRDSAVARGLAGRVSFIEESARIPRVPGTGLPHAHPAAVTLRRGLRSPERDLGFAGGCAAVLAGRAVRRSFVAQVPLLAVDAPAVAGE